MGILDDIPIVMGMETINNKLTIVLLNMVLVPLLIYFEFNLACFYVLLFDSLKSPMPWLGKLRDRLVRFELEEAGTEHGHGGTIPILRKDFRKIQSTKSFKGYLSNHGHKAYPVLFEGLLHIVL